ncbi:nitroreductase [Lachnospiraceae bacterium PF1-22]|uniref:nitroreductase family protein n=1 Tax=Ohessyouella blattaphilus TaxID=2949333 RepID=UPI003E21D9F5
MDLLPIVEKRISRRTYQPTPLTDKDPSSLQMIIERYSGPGYRMQIYEGNLKAHYGLFSGVNTVILMIADKKDPYSEEKLGYYGELVVLEATALGLGTCWMGMYNTKSAPISLAEDEYIALAITIGYVEAPKMKERLIRKVAHRKTKSIEELTNIEKKPPEWFVKGMEAVQLAPSAMNRQPVTFTCRDDLVTASVSDISTHAMAIDLGIAKAHFALGAGGSWEWGNGEKFNKND